MTARQFVAALTLGTVSAVISLTAMTALTTPSCVQKDAVKAQGTGDIASPHTEIAATMPVGIAATMPVASGNLSATTQPADQSDSGTKTAGRDQTTWHFPLNLSGSGWALLAGLMAVLAFLAYRERLHAKDRANDRRVMRVVRTMPPGDVKDAFLAEMTVLPHAARWDALVTRSGQRTKRLNKP